MSNLVQMQEANNAYNAAQAQLNRDWQMEMSNSAHQREVQDLIAAGLNPVLSANSGATVGSVGNANADSSAISALGSISAASVAANAAIRAASINGVSGVVKTALENPQAVIALGLEDLFTDNSFLTSGLQGLYENSGIDVLSIGEQITNSANRYMFSFDKFKDNQFRFYN